MRLSDCVVSGVWEGRHGGRHTHQQEQQLPDLPSGRAPPLQVCRSPAPWLGFIMKVTCEGHVCNASLIRISQMCHWGSVAGDHAGMYAWKTVRPRVRLQPRRGDDMWQRLCDRLFHHLLHALRFPGTHKCLSLTPRGWMDQTLDKSQTTCNTPVIHL